MTIFLFANGIGASQQAADSQQTTDAMSAITGALIIASLQESCQTLLDQDKQNVFETSIGNDPSTYDPNTGTYQPIPQGHQAGYMATYQGIYQTDGSITSSQISERQTDLSNLKQQTQTDGTLMKNTFSLLDPIDQYYQLIVSSIASWAGAGKG